MVEIPDRELEEYSFLRLYSIDFEMAKQACDLLSRQTSDELRYCILRDIVVSYARPFSKNRGRLIRLHRLEADLVPVAMRPLHTELVTLRDQVFAHSDQEFRKPQLARWPRKDGTATYPMGFRNPAYDQLLARMAEVRVMVIALESLVNESVASHERVFDQLHSAQGGE